MIPTSIPITLRATKGTPLTAPEMDGNLISLRDAILGLGAEFGSGRVVIGAEPPLGQRVGVAWIPSDYRGIYVWNSGTSKWVRVSEPTRYATATNTGNAYVATVPGEYESIDSFIGVPIYIRIAAANTGATTLAVNGFAAKDVKKSGASALSGGELTVNHVAVLIYDGASFILLNPISAAVVSPTRWTSAEIAFPATAPGKVEIDHPLGEKPDFCRVVAVCKEADSGFDVGQEVEIYSFSADVDASDWDEPLVSVAWNTTKCIVGVAKADFDVRFVSVGGTMSSLTYALFKTKFRLKIRAERWPA